MDTKLPDSEVRIKVSMCPKCKGWVRAAVEHLMDNKNSKQFLKEVIKHRLDVKTIPLLEWRKGEIEMCDC